MTFVMVLDQTENLVVDTIATLQNIKAVSDVQTQLNLLLTA